MFLTLVEKYTWRVSIISFFFSSVNSFAQANVVKIYPFKSAIIEYKYEADMSGTHVKYIDDFGYKQADYYTKEEEKERYVVKQKKTIILVGDRAYTIDYATSTVSIGLNSTYSYYTKYANISPERVNEAIIRAEGFKNISKINYLGRECKVWKASKAKRVTWESIPLETTTTFFTMIVEKATKVDVNIDIKSSVFEIPQGFRYISADVYQGYAGLNLSFDEKAKGNNKNPDNLHIKVKFNSSELVECNDIPFYTQDGEEIVQYGDNDYNKIDLKIIKSQDSQLGTDTVSLGKYRTAIFIQDNGNVGSGTSFGKIQIKQIGRDTFLYRYMIFDEENNVKSYSNGANDAISRIVKIKLDHKHKSLILIPIGKTKIKILDY
jgi:hypothetical protein